MSGNASWNDNIIAQFRANGGTVEQFGDSLILVHHVGAKTGAERIAPVMGIRGDDDTWFIAASKAGAPQNPGWYHNLLAQPETKIETPDGIVPVRVTELAGAARDDAWEQFTSASPGFAEYQERTTRTIPVLALRRITESAA